MPAQTGYYDVTRNAIARMLPPSTGAAAQIDPTADPSIYAAIMNSMGTGGEPETGTAWGPPQLSGDQNDPTRNPYVDTPIDLGGQEVSSPVYSQAQGQALYNQARKEEDPNRNLVNVNLGTPGAAALVNMGAIAAGGGLAGGGAPAATVAPEAGSGVGASVVPDISTVGDAAAGVPTEALSAPSTGSESAGWFSKISNLIPKGGMGGGGGSNATPAYGDYSRIADQLSRAQINDQRRQVAAQAGAQGQSLQDMKRRRIAALMMAGTPQVPA